MPACMYVQENSLAAIQAAKRLAGVALEVNLRVHVTCMPLPIMNKAAHSGFQTQRRRHQKSKKQEYQWPNKKDLCLSKVKIKIRNKFNPNETVYQKPD